MQHPDSNFREEDVENELSNKNPLHGRAEENDMGPLVAFFRRTAELDLL